MLQLICRLISRSFAACTFAGSFVPASILYIIIFKTVSLQKHMDHVRPTTNLAKKPPQRLAQEKDRTHERDATPMGYEPKVSVKP